MSENLKWGLSTPLQYNDPKYGTVELNSFGTFSYQITNPDFFDRAFSNAKSKNPALEPAAFTQHFIWNALAHVLEEKNSAGVPSMTLSMSVKGDALIPIANHMAFAYGFEFTDIKIMRIAYTEASNKKINQRNKQEILAKMQES